MVKSLLRGGERVLSFEYGMPMDKERLGSSIPYSLPLLGSKTLSITLCTVSRRAIGSFGIEAILSTEACKYIYIYKDIYRVLPSLFKASGTSFFAQLPIPPPCGTPPT